MPPHQQLAGGLAPSFGGFGYARSHNKSTSDLILRRYESSVVAPSEKPTEYAAVKPAKKARTMRPAVSPTRPSPEQRAVLVRSRSEEDDSPLTPIDSSPVTPESSRFLLTQTSPTDSSFAPSPRSPLDIPSARSYSGADCCSCEKHLQKLLDEGELVSVRRDFSIKGKERPLQLRDYEKRVPSEKEWEAMVSARHAQAAAPPVPTLQPSAVITHTRQRSRNGSTTAADRSKRLSRSVSPSRQRRRQNPTEKGLAKPVTTDIWRHHRTPSSTSSTSTNPSRSGSNSGASHHHHRRHHQHQRSIGGNISPKPFPAYEELQLQHTRNLSTSSTTSTGSGSLYPLPKPTYVPDVAPYPALVRPHVVATPPAPALSRLRTKLKSEIRGALTRKATDASEGGAVGPATASSAGNAAAATSAASAGGESGERKVRATWRRKKELVVKVQAVHWTEMDF